MPIVSDDHGIREKEHKIRLAERDALTTGRIHYVWLDSERGWCYSAQNTFAMRRALSSCQLVAVCHPGTTERL